MTGWQDGIVYRLFQPRRSRRLSVKVALFGECPPNSTTQPNLRPAMNPGAARLPSVLPLLPPRIARTSQNRSELHRLTPGPTQAVSFL
jgi:hypothetical protein